MNVSPPEGVRYTLPAEARSRLEVSRKLRELYTSWGYAFVELPVLERYDPDHPAREKAFKLSDAGGGLLALRADFTPAVAKLVGSCYPEVADAEAEPRRLQYCGKLWQATPPDAARTREFTQLGLELLGVSNARADAELIHLARESVRAVGLTPRVEVGNPGVVRALFDLAGVPEGAREALAAALDHKDQRTLSEALEPLHLAPDLAAALLSVPDLYGGADIVRQAHQRMPWPEVRRELERLEALLEEFEDDSELLLDLGMARRLAYYTGVTFRAYTFDFGRPLLGGGRYDGALLPCAAGFALGLERLLEAAPTRHEGTDEGTAPLLLSTADAPARFFRARGYTVERALETDLSRLRAYAKRRGIPYLLTDGGLEPLASQPPELEALTALLEEARARA